MFKDKLKQLRLEKNVTQADIASAIGVSPATIGNYEQGTREPRNTVIYKKLADYFDVPFEFLIDKSDTPYTPISNKEDLLQYLEYKQGIPIIYDGIDITDLVLGSSNNEANYSSEQMFAWMEFVGRSGHILYARRELLYILNKIKKSSKEYIVSNLDEFAIPINERVVSSYKRCWNNIEHLSPNVNSIESLLDLLFICINLDSLAEKVFSLVPLNDDFYWLRDKLL